VVPSSASVTRLARSGVLAVGVVVMIALVLLVPGLGGYGFDDPGEGMHAEIAREMVAGGDWLTLHLNGVRYFDKPPLLYWIAAAGLHVAGATEGAVRVAPLAGAVLALAATTLLGTALGGARVGIVAGLALLTCPGFFAYARYVRPETWLLAAVQGGFTLLLWPAAPPLIAILGGAALGVAALAKDLLGTAAPLILIGLVRWGAGRLRPVRAWLPPAAVALAVLIPGVWYALVEWRDPGFLWYTVVDNHLLNVARARLFPDEDVPLGGLEFLAVAALGALPWIVPATATIASLVRCRAWRHEDELPWVVMAAWAIAVFAVFTLSPFKLPHYGLPAYPALALLAARWWHREPWGRRLAMLQAAVLAAVALGALCAVWWDWAAALGRIVEATDVYTRKELAAGQASPLPQWPVFRSLVAVTGVVFAAGALGLAVAGIARSRRLGLGVVLIAMLAWMPCVGRGLAAVADGRAVRVLAREAASRMGPDDLLVHEGPIENSGAIEFYGGRRPRILDGRTSVLGFGSTFADAAETFWDRDRLFQAWSGRQRIFLLTVREPVRSAVSALPPGQVFLVAAGGGRWLYSNRP
jgi:4-amino-4-deoxy-L-arabinose transferase-like glycosyltransferase